tara:strand:- start:301 stop:744 length:444 start_codon:yes stop_codon:yes gene_type:complete
VANTIKVQSTEGKVDNKKCNTCKETKAINKFYLTRYNTYEKDCKRCRNDKREKNHRHWKQEFIYKLSEYIEIQCVKCGYDKNFSALDFHHIKNKRYSIARAIRNLSNKNFYDGRVDDILYEILVNCEILCANCHREHHNKHIMKMKK